VWIFAINFDVFQSYEELKIDFNTKVLKTFTKKKVFYDTYILYIVAKFYTFAIFTGIGVKLV